MTTDTIPRIRPGDRLCRKPEAMRITSIKSNTTWWRLIREGVLPEPIHISSQVRAWIDRELYDALNRIATQGGRRA